MDMIVEERNLPAGIYGVKRVTQSARAEEISFKNIPSPSITRKSLNDSAQAQTKGTLFVSLQLNSPSEPYNIKEMEQTKLA
jgi:hypothetical protein